MTDTTVTKVSSAHSPTGDQNEVCLASGKRVSMRLWRDEAPTQGKGARKHEYEVVGYVTSVRAELEIEWQTVRLEPGNSWVVPAGGDVRKQQAKSGCNRQPSLAEQFNILATLRLGYGISIHLSSSQIRDRTGGGALAIPMGFHDREERGGQVRGRADLVTATLKRPTLP